MSWLRSIIFFGGGWERLAYSQAPGAKVEPQAGDTVWSPDCDQGWKENLQSKGLSAVPGKVEATYKVTQGKV
jgi:hypothetical protein